MASPSITMDSTTVATINSNSILSHLKQSDDEILEVTDYYLTRSQRTTPCEQYQTQPHYSHETENESISPSEEDHNVQLINRNNSYIRVPHTIEETRSSSEESFAHADIETLDSETDESDDELSIPDYTHIDENGMDGLMRFGLYTPSAESVNDHGQYDSDELTVPDYVQIDESNTDELMRFGLYDENDDTENDVEQSYQYLQYEYIHTATNSSSFQFPQADADVPSTKVPKTMDSTDFFTEDSHEMVIDAFECLVEDKFMSSSSHGSTVVVYTGPRYQQPAYEFGAIETSETEHSALVEEKFRSSSSDDDTVVVYTGPRYQPTAYEFGEIETLETEHSERSLNLSSTSESDVEVYVSPMKRAVEGVNEVQISREADCRQEKQELLEIDEEDVRKSNKQSLVQKAVEENLENELETAQDFEENVIKVFDAEMKEREEGESKGTNAEESTETEEEGKESLSKNSSSSIFANTNKPQCPVRRKRDVLKRVGRMFGKCFRRTGRNHEAPSTR